MTPSRRGSPLGLLLVAAGLVALLVSLGAIPGERLLALIDLWPVLLIVVGLLLVIRRLLPAPASTMLGALVLAVASVGALAYAAVTPVPSSETTTAAAPLSGLDKAALELGLGAATVDVGARSLGGDLYRATFEFPKGQAPQVTVENGTVSIGDRGFRLGRSGLGPRHVAITLNSDIPWTVSIGGGATNGSLDLRQLKLSSLDVSGGANRETVQLPQPYGTVRVSIAGGASSVTLHRPAASEASVHVSGGASSLLADGHRVGALGGDADWSTPGFEAAADRYAIDLSGGASRVTVDKSG